MLGPWPSVAGVEVSRRVLVDVVSLGSWVTPVVVGVVGPRILFGGGPGLETWPGVLPRGRLNGGSTSPGVPGGEGWLAPWPALVVLLRPWGTPVAVGVVGPRVLPGGRLGRDTWSGGLPHSRLHVGSTSPGVPGGRGGPGGPEGRVPAGSRLPAAGGSVAIDLGVRRGVEGDFILLLLPLSPADVRFLLDYTRRGGGSLGFWSFRTLCSTAGRPAAARPVS